MTAAEVHDEPERSRFTARVEGRLAGVAAYELADGVITFTHTVVGDDFEGQGVGSALARTALDAARERGLAVVPRCPFIAGWIEHHPDYADLVRDA
ncbi:GNAT family N-acetyltransferase [Microlunatus capsulatus]|uniref:GNAT family acetyltransferase n=1 Tax=Microlunatus capsulatus TaxID=99117 RepID=A0ABS4ZD73_9ACTN|nr:GNAT family N-acetyltransferase [Microlunatus capsulatus]MBP2418123.1 putative GNAT family acetyltransferase [Microlunatus capsulatus]